MEKVLEMLFMLFEARIYLLEQNDYQADYTKEYMYMFFQHMTILVFNYYPKEPENPLKQRLD